LGLRIELGALLGFVDGLGCPEGYMLGIVLGDGLGLGDGTLLTAGLGDDLGDTLLAAKLRATLGEILLLTSALLGAFDTIVESAAETAARI